MDKPAPLPGKSYQDSEIGDVLAKDYGVVKGGPARNRRAGQPSELCVLAVCSTLHARSVVMRRHLLQASSCTRPPCRGHMARARSAARRSALWTGWRRLACRCSSPLQLPTSTACGAVCCSCTSSCRSGTRTCTRSSPNACD